MKIKTFESTDTNVKKFVFEWGDQPSEKKGIAEAVLYRYGEYLARSGKRHHNILRRKRLMKAS